MSLRKPLIILISLLLSSMSNADDSLDLGPYMHFIEDKERTLTFASIKNAHPNNFQRPPWTGFIAKNSGSSMYWFRIDITEIDNEFSEESILYFPYREYTSLTYYKPYENGDYKEYQVGRKHGMQAKDISSIHLAFSSSESGWRNHPIYLKVDFSDYPITRTIPAFLYSKDDYLIKSQRLILGSAIVYGLFITMIIYNLAFFFAIKERFFIYYLVYVASACVVCMGNDGTWLSYIMPLSGSLPTRVLDCITILGCICGYLAFITSLFKARITMPITYKLAVSVIVCGVISSFVTLFELSDSQLFSKQTVGTYSLCISIALMVNAKRVGIHVVNYVFIFYIPMLLLASIYSSYLAGIFQHNIFMPWALTAGQAFETLALSILLGSMIKNIILERETAQHLAEHAREEANKYEQRHNERNRFIAQIGHSLRKPLHYLRLNIASLKIGTPNEEMTENLSNLKSYVDDIETMVADILYISQFESTINKSGVLRRPIKTIMNEIYTDSLVTASQKNLKLKMFCANNNESMLDSDIFKKIIQKLVNNSIKHTREGGILISYRVRHEHNLFQIYDTCTTLNLEPGDDKQLLELEGNLDLNLYMVNNLAQFVGANISVRTSRHGKGTCFSVLVPKNSIK